MHLFVQREKPDRATMSRVYVDGEFLYHGMEPKYVNPGIKIMGQTAIPSGSYFLTLTHSPTFGRVLPQVMNVPSFTGIRIHRLNRVFETAGCLGIGFQRGKDPDGSPVIWQSAKAEEDLIARLQEAEKREIIGITYKDYA